MAAAGGHCSPDTQPPKAPAHSVWGHLSTTQSIKKIQTFIYLKENTRNVFKNTNRKLCSCGDYLESTAVYHSSCWLTELLEHIT